MNRRGERLLGALVSAALVAAAGSDVPAAEATPSVVAAPIHAVRVAWGQIGYRDVGRGRPLVLVMGGGAATGSIDNWPPSFIDALAVHHRVLVLDNEGVGLTTLRSGRLTISRMADDTAAFIAALHLRVPDVLGWSMGGFIVQALAARHAGFVRRLVLCATGPGNGRFTGGGAVPRGWIGPLFPPDQTPARTRFYSEIRSYPSFYGVPPAVQSLQNNAIHRWILGVDPAGSQTNRIRALALIGAGAQDPLDPPANSRILAAAIPHARLQIYPDAAHGFLFQDAADWTGRIQRFLR